MGLAEKLGAAGLGVATGTIIIDTSKLRGAASIAANYGMQIKRSIGGSTPEIEKQQVAFEGLTREIRRLTMAATALFTIGIGAASFFEEARVVLTGLVRDEQKALVLNEKIRDTAREMGVSYGELLHATRLILPTMEGQTDELEAQWALIRRVAVLNPAQGIAMAAFAVNEALVSGGRDLMSLAERFNVSRSIFREEFVKANRDFWMALDETLNRMGITAEVADNMAKTFQASFKVMRDSLVQLVAEGFAPLLNYINPLLRSASEWVAEAREANSVTLTWVAALAGIAAIGGPTLLVLARLKTAMAALRISALGPVGIGVGIGGALGFGGVRGYGKVMDNERLKGYGLEEFTQDLKAIVVTALFRAADGLNALDEAAVNLQEGLYLWLANLDTGFGNFLERLNMMVPGGANRASGAAKYFEDAEVMRENAARVRARGDVDRAARSKTVAGLREWLNPSSQLMAFTPHPGAGRFDPNQMKAIEDWASGVKKIEEKAGEARLKATQSFENQRAQLHQRYNLNVLREAEDFARARTRQAEDLARSIVDIREDQKLREDQWWEDYYEAQTEKREDAANKLKEIEETYAKDREKLLRDHRESLLQAASRLDARAVAEEQRNFAKSLQNLDEKYDDQRKSVKEKLEEQEEDTRKALEKRIARAREADDFRIAAMIEELSRRQALEDEDRALRQQRQREDHNQQLIDLKKNYDDRLVAINAQEVKERTALDEAFQKQMASLNLFNFDYIDKTQKNLDAATALWDKFWFQWKTSMQEAAEAVMTYDSEGNPIGIRYPGASTTTYALGGPINRTGMALVHAGEYVLNAATTRALGNSMGSMSQHGLLSKMGGGGITIAEGAIQIFGAEGQDPREIGVIVRAEMIAALEYSG